MKMQMLMMVAAAALVSSLSEGLILSKCELKSKLEAAALQLPERVKAKGLSEENFIAKIVCHVEKSTGFNTSVVTQLTPNAGTPTPQRRKRAAKGAGRFSMARYRVRGGKRSSEEDSGSHEGSDSGEVLETVWNLYGLFQLSDHVICASGSDPTPNLCQINCSDLIDDDITDDINCIEEIKMTMESGIGEHNEALKRMFMLLFQRECSDVVASQYFQC